LSILVPASFYALAQKKTLDSKLHHLRKGSAREWSEFPVHAKDSVLIVNFNLTTVPGEACISFRQYDVNQSWVLTLNGTKLGELEQDEKDMIRYFQIPPGYLKKGNNQLKLSSSVRGVNSDDIRVGQIEFYSQSLNKILSASSFEVEIRDKKTKKFLPSKITVVDLNGSLRPLGIKRKDDIAVRTGVIYTSKGKVSFNLPVGSYIIYASRGFEYSVDSFRVQLKRGSTLSKSFYINREVNTEGWISSDPHIHTLAYSGHGDATLNERLISIAGEGLELPVFTEHNLPVMVIPELKVLQLQSYFTPVTGNEVTTRIGHFNIFPVQPGTITPYNAENWNVLNDYIKKSEGVKVVILNHARDIHQGFRPFDPKHHLSSVGMDLRKWEFPANAMEVLNSGSQQSDQLELHRDWFGMLNRGYSLTAVGSSDSHDVNRYLIGQARTYISSSNDERSVINEDKVIDNFVSGRTLMSFGLFTEMKVNNKFAHGELASSSNKLVVSISVQGPSWVNADKVSLYANGIKIKEAVIKKTNKALKWTGVWEIPSPNHDVYLVAIAEGPAVKFPFWQIAKPFQHSSANWDPRVIGSTGVIRIDADGDGQFSAAYYYAKRLWENSDGNFDALFKSLGRYDEAVAIQVAAVITEAGFDVTSREISEALQKANSKVRRGFQTFIRDLKASELF